MGKPGFQGQAMITTHDDNHLKPCLWLQNEALKRAKPMVVVGTPGRLAELSRAGQLQMHQTGILVLDEVCHAMF